MAIPRTTLLSSLLTALLGACTNVEDPTVFEGRYVGDGTGPTDSSQVSVELGLPGGEDGLEFAPFVNGAELERQTFGQGGNHVFLAVRGHGFGRRAYVSLTVRDPATGDQAVSPAPSRPQLFECDEDERICDLVPILASTSGLHNQDGAPLPVQITVRVRHHEGAEAEATVDALLGALL